MFGDGDLTLSTLKLWSTLEFSRVFFVFADVHNVGHRALGTVVILPIYVYTDITVDVGELLCCIDKVECVSHGTCIQK